MSEGKEKSIKQFKFKHLMWVDAAEIISVNVDAMYGFCVIIYNEQKTQYAVVALSKIMDIDMRQIICSEKMLKNYSLYVCRTNHKILVDDAAQ